MAWWRSGPAGEMTWRVCSGPEVKYSITLVEQSVVPAFFSLPPASFLLGRHFRHDPAWLTLSYPSVTLSSLQAAALVLFVASPAAAKGSTERLAISLDLAWLTWLSQALHAETME